MNRSIHREIVGVDPSTKLGLCVDGEVSQISFGSVKKGDRVGEIDRLNQIYYWPDTLPATAIVFIEGYSYASKYFAHQAGEIGGAIRLRLATRGIPFVEIAPKGVKKYATANGNAGKPAMIMEAYKRLDVEELNDNKVDALWLWAMGMDFLGQPVAKMPAKNREALDELQVYGHIDTLGSSPTDTAA